MNIGFVSKWFERGAAYVTKNYINLLKDKHNVFVYARGGENHKTNDPNWNLPYVTWGPHLYSSLINFRHFKKWIIKNNIDVILFNEQKDAEIVYLTKKEFPHIKIGSYIDYYKENTVREFFLYDFLICNTERHYSVFKDHPQCYYIPWGTNTDLFKPYDNDKKTDEVIFFHSAGMSNRKGTTFVIDAFIKGELYKENAKLIIHTQKSLKDVFGYDEKKLEKYNIDVINKTVTAPGLYYLADVYVYPTTLDGLGLTMYESLASGLPVIATDHPPMNEIINERVGYLVKVDKLISRYDGYYWPLAIINENSLTEGMKSFIHNPMKLKKMQKQARDEALSKWDWSKRQKDIENVFENSKVIIEKADASYLKNKTKMEKLINKFGSSYLYSLLGLKKNDLVI